MGPLQAVLDGRYRIERRLGHGAMAVVYRAQRIDDGRTVAIKVMRPEIGYEDGVVERFHIEVAVMEQLDHPRIVRIRDHGGAGEILWFAMDLVEGTSLAGVLQSEPVGWRRAAQFLADAAGALRYAHERGVVHRDIKPANVLVNLSGRFLVTDFGVARIVGSERLTATGLAVGTPAYMSPEQLISGADVTPASDQYSLGVVAYQMITGVTPPSAALANDSDPAGARRRRPVRALAPDCPRVLAALVGRMLAPDPADRWADLYLVSIHAQEIAETGASPSLPVAGPTARVAAALKRLIG